MTYRVTFWCRDCIGDPYGCFDGLTEELGEEFATADEAHTAGQETCRGGPPWDYEVYEVPDGNPRELRMIETIPIPL